MRRSLVTFYQAFPERDSQVIGSRIRSMKGEVEHSFISLNYTDVFDRCCRVTQEILSRKFGEHLCDDETKCPHVFDKRGVFHLHGTLDSEMILGVNDSSQIKGESFRKNELDRQSLVKPEMNRRYGNQKEAIARQLINDSSVICTFGVSIGETDKMWWQEIGKWLISQDDHMFIVCTRLKDPKETNIPRPLFLHENQMLDKIRMTMELDAESWSKIRGQIFIETHPNLFNFKLA